MDFRLALLTLTSAFGFTLLIISSSAYANPAPAQADISISIPFSTKPWTIDGELSDGIWQDAIQISLDIETDPQENIKANVTTTAYLAESGDYLLVAFDARTPHPSKIRAAYRGRDQAGLDDLVGIVLDTFNDEKRAFQFFSNPLGAQIDSIRDDVTNREDGSWDAAWESEGTITNTGYIVEMALPLNILRFNSGQTRQTWGLDLIRYYHNGDKQRISFQNRDRDIACYLCQLKKVQGFTNAKPSKNIEFVPSLVATDGETRDISENEPWQDTNSVELGLDLRWGITPSSTLNATINPDFSQVEADASQLSVNSNFSLFFPEKRPFFLDSADYFTTFADVVYTRNIAAPDIGLKFTNKNGANTTGAFFIDDEQTNFIVPRYDGSDVETLERKSQNAVFRYRRNIGNNSTIGAISTLRSADDYENTLIGIDGKYQIDSNHSARFQVLTTQTHNPDEVIHNDDGELLLDKTQSGDAIQLAYDYSSRDMFVYANYRQFDKDFRADLGFITKVDYDFKVIGGGRVWHGTPSTWWNRIELSGDLDITHRNDGLKLEQEAELHLGISGPLQSYTELTVVQRDEFFDNEYYNQVFYGFYGNIKPRTGLLLELWTRTGDTIDFSNGQAAKLFQFNPTIEWSFGLHASVRAGLRHDKLTVEAGELFTADSADLRLNYQFTNRSALRFSAQQTKITRNVRLYDNPSDEEQYSRSLNTQLLYSYKLTPQSVFFLGYSDGGLENDDITKFTHENKTVFMKLSYAWLPK